MGVHQASYRVPDTQYPRVTSKITPRLGQISELILSKTRGAHTAKVAVLGSSCGDFSIDASFGVSTFSLIEKSAVTFVRGSVLSCAILLPIRPEI